MFYQNQLILAGSRNAAPDSSEVRLGWYKQAWLSYCSEIPTEKLSGLMTEAYSGLELGEDTNLPRPSGGWSCFHRLLLLLWILETVTSLICLTYRAESTLPAGTTPINICWKRRIGFFNLFFQLTLLVSVPERPLSSYFKKLISLVSWFEWHLFSFIDSNFNVPKGPWESVPSPLPLCSRRHRHVPADGTLYSSVCCWQDL